MKVAFELTPANPTNRTNPRLCASFPVVAPATWHNTELAEGRRLCGCPEGKSPSKAVTDLQYQKFRILFSLWLYPLHFNSHASLISALILRASSHVHRQPLHHPSSLENRVQAGRQQSVIPHLFARNQLGQAAPKPRLARQDKTSHASSSLASQLQLQHCISDLPDTTTLVLLIASSTIPPVISRSR
jgi:hypothetical protein